jgi:hypothetical protein
MTKEETLEQLGARLFKEGKGLWNFWNDAPDTSAETFNRMLVGYQSEQDKCKDEPAAVVSGYFGGKCVVVSLNTARIFNSGTAFYTTPPQRKPLTDEEVLRLLSKIDECAVRLPRGLREFARAIEAAHGITGDNK